MDSKIDKIIHEYNHEKVGVFVRVRTRERERERERKREEEKERECVIRNQKVKDGAIDMNVLVTCSHFSS